MNLNIIFISLHKNSLQDFISSVVSCYPDIKITKVVWSNSLEISNDADLLCVEIVDKNQLQKLQSLIECKIPIIVVGNQHGVIVEVLSMNVLNYIIDPFYADKIYAVFHSLEVKYSEEKLQSQLLYHKGTLAGERANTITISNTEGFVVVNILDILHIDAERSYCSVYLQNGEVITISKPLKEIEYMLPSNIFFRSHHSHIININAMVRYIKKDGGHAELLNGSLVPVSSSKKDELLKFLEFI